MLRVLIEVINTNLFKAHIKDERGNVHLFLCEFSEIMKALTINLTIHIDNCYNIVKLFNQGEKTQ